VPPAGFEPAPHAPEACALSPELRGLHDEVRASRENRGDSIARMAATKKRILICDDDPAILRVLQVNLEIEGYDVLPAQNGEQAVEVATEERPDLVILDIMMPRLDGYQACERLKANEDTKDIPVVFLSAKAQQSDIQRGKDYGVAEYLTKPFDPMDLLGVVERLLA
jgi:CheY-like chemotaxis protein